MFPYFSTILYVHFGNSMEGKSTSGVGNPRASHPPNESLLPTVWDASVLCLPIFLNAFSCLVPRINRGRGQ